MQCSHLKNTEGSQRAICGNASRRPHTTTREMRNGATPRYILAKQFGPAHDRIFGVKVSIKGKVEGVGAGKSKKEAEQRAARRTLRKLNLYAERENG